MTVEFLIGWLILFSVNLAATVVPGPAFVMCLRNALRYSRKTGIVTALGLAAGVMPHVVLAIGGLAALLHSSVFFFNLIKYAGAAYLIYMGWKALFSKDHATIDLEDVHTKKEDIQPVKAFTQGLLTNTLNPKAVLFFSAIFAQFITPDMPVAQKVLYGITPSLVEGAWFSMVAVILTHTRIKAIFIKIIKWIDRLCGGLFIGLGARLATLQGAVGP